MPDDPGQSSQWQDTLRSQHSVSVTPLDRDEHREDSSGTLLVLGGTVATHVLYAMNEDGNLGSTELLIGVLIASIVATAVFCACRRILSSRRARIVTGISVIYLTWLVILLAENPESRMWLPVIVIFGIPFTAPVLIATWFASGLFVSPVVPLQAVGSDQPKR